MSRPRSGFTVAELLVVLVIIGLLSGLALPKLQRMRSSGNMSSATVQFSRTVTLARQAAIQWGKRAYFEQQGSRVWVTVDTIGNKTHLYTIVRPIAFDSMYNIQITSPATRTIEFDPRGVATQADTAVFHFKHSSGYQDSLCVSRLGNTIRRACPS